MKPKQENLAADWPPAEAYPVVVRSGPEPEGVMAPGWKPDHITYAELVDFGDRLISVPNPGYEIIAEAERVIKALLRERAAQGLPMPYPSSIASLKDREGFVAMVSTQGWNEIKEEDEPE